MMRLPNQNQKPAAQLLIGTGIRNTRDNKEKQGIFIWYPENERSERILIYSSNSIISHL